MSTLSSPHARLAACALMLVLLACDERSPSAPSGAGPRELRVQAGDGQHAAAGAALPEALIVAALDADGRPVPGALVQFVVLAGGGAVAPQTAATDAQGLARTGWTLGTVAADSQVVEARVAGVPSLRMRADARPDVPAALVAAGGGAAGQVGTPLPDSLAVAVNDRFGNPVDGVEVAWEVAAGGGTVSPPRSVTRADGTSRAQWTLGPRADTAQVALVRVGSLAPVALTANAVTRGVPLQLAKRGGDGQRGPAGGVLPEWLEVVLRMPDGRPVRGAVVAWSVPPGAGTVLPAVSRTDSAGAASAVWRLGTGAGLVQATATVDDGSLVFTALVEAQAPAEMVRAGGDGGAGPVGGALPDPLAVRLRDRHGNPVAGAEVEWEALDGGGALQPARSLTDAAGVARTRWVLGPRVDAPQAAQARVPGLPPVGFTASATTRGAPLQLAKRGGDGQRGPAGAVLADSLRVVLRMPDGRPVAGAAVAWGAPAEAGAVAPALAYTDAEGTASAAWRLGTSAGLVQATATVDEGTLVFTALVQAAAPARMVAAGGGGEGQVATPLPDSLVVRVTDRYGNPVPGAEVDWAALTGGGQLQPARSASDARGVARAQWTLGALAGPPGQTASATLAGLPPVAFHATAATRGVTLLLARTGGDGQTGPVGRVLADSLEVQLRTPAGVPVQGASVVWLALGGGGGVSPPASRTDADGRARAAWTLGTAAGGATASARVDDGALAFSATAVAAGPASVAAFSGDGQSTTRGTALADSLVAFVADAHGNPVPGAEVRWSVLAGAGHLERRLSTTDAGGLARTRWAVGFRPGENAVEASVQGVGAARFTATGTEGVLTLRGTSRISVWQTGHTVYHVQGQRSVRVTDALGRRAIGAPIVWGSNEQPTLPTTTDWDTSSVIRLDYEAWTGWLPLPYSIAEFEGQRVVFGFSEASSFYREQYLPRGNGPYPANDTVPVAIHWYYQGMGPNDGEEIDVQVRLFDDEGWTLLTNTHGREVTWPLGPRTGTRTLTICLPEPYAIPEECSSITITVVP